MTLLSADLLARAIIASAVSYGDDPILACKAKTGSRRRSLAAATYGVHYATDVPLAHICRVLATAQPSACRAKANGGDVFAKAAEAAADAVRYDLKARFLGIKTAPAPKPPRGARAMPRGAKLVSMGEGVVRIVRKPIPESTARHAAQQIALGASIDDLADLFDFEAEDLLAAVNAVQQTGVAA